MGQPSAQELVLLFLWRCETARTGGDFGFSASFSAVFGLQLACTCPFKPHLKHLGLRPSTKALRVLPTLTKSQSSKLSSVAGVDCNKISMACPPQCSAGTLSICRMLILSSCPQNSAATTQVTSISNSTSSILHLFSVF